MNVRALKQVCLAAAAVVTLCPLSSQAASIKQLDTCINQFVAEHVPSGHRVADIVKVRPRRDVYDGLRSRFTYRLRAVGADSGEEIASASCTVNRKGELLAMRVDTSKVRFADARHAAKDDRSAG